MTALYSVEFTSEAKKQIKKLDNYEAILILSWIHKNIEGCMDPRAHGKALTAQFKECWRYRVGNYRLIAKIEDERILILILSIGHRRDIYKKYHL